MARIDRCAPHSSLTIFRYHILYKHRREEMWGEAIIRCLGCPSYPTTGPARNQQPLLTAFVPPPLSLQTKHRDRKTIVSPHQRALLFLRPSPTAETQPARWQTTSSTSQSSSATSTTRPSMPTASSSAHCTATRACSPTSRALFRASPRSLRSSLYVDSQPLRAHLDPAQREDDDTRPRNSLVLWPSSDDR